MQYVRLIKKEGGMELRKGTKVSIQFDRGIVAIWTGSYWKEYPIKDFRVIATWDGEEDYSE